MKSAMTLYGIETTLSFPPYRFHVTVDSGAEVGLDQRDIEWSEQDQFGHWSEPLWVRSFYFEDCDRQHIRNFCKKFAQDQAYRTACLDGATDWSQRDRLFVRNIAPLLWQESVVIRTLGGLSKHIPFSSNTGRRLSVSQLINRSSLPIVRFNLPARSSIPKLKRQYSFLIPFQGSARSFRVKESRERCATRILKYSS
jgi:hypothetical protein